ncbi:MAG: UDP-N-acetylmuramoyl-tripeptide--D-alanyl-D-alanine ligase [Rubrivivax sp.]|nr:UDP-N-acetylmuramoyl-tripeptide--D-alanyl-D-alanine ligase [Rubrivivax sp.]
MMFTLAQAQALLPGSTLVGDGSTPIHRVHTDTRTLQPGDLFAALKGERFDGHDYLREARAAGAVAALAEHGLGAATLPGLQVADSLQGLQQLAAAWRAQFSLPLVAVTGSNGKTTVTQMLAAILRAAFGDAMLATAGNLNNHIGVPLTLLRLRSDHRAAVLELGMNHAGEIALLAALARPTVALVNNAQREHQEFMASVEAVARENGAVIDVLPADGSVVIPADDTYTPLWRGMSGARRVLTFSDTAPADVTGDASWNATAAHWALTLHTQAGQVDTTLHQAGRHNLRNALAAAAAALAVGVPLADIAAGLAAFAPVAGRSQTLALVLDGRSVTLVDDSYNANPDSVLAAIGLLADMPGPRWLVLGDMGEVGSEGPRFHAEVGAAARGAGIEFVWAAGALCAHAGAGRHFDSVAELLSALPAATPAAASVLVKGSRFMQMEQVVRVLKKLSAPPAAPGTEAEHAA